MLSRKVMSGGGAPTDPYFKNVVLLLHGDGTNGGQNNTFVDSSSNNFTITRNGNPTQGSFNPYGTFWSNYFDGQYSYLGIADNVNLRPGAGAFTIEAWIYRNAAGAAHTIFAKGSPSTGIVFQVTSSNTLQFTHTTTNITSTGTVAAYTWTHVAVVREGTGTNQTKLYINGTADGQGTVSTDFTQTNGVHIGTNRSLGEDFRGYISNLRFVKGTAVYTGNFTPPSANLTAISNTSLLTCQSNRLVDNSTNNFAFTITYSGVTSFAPFAPKSAYTTAQGGSGYFDGSGDSVVTPSSSSLSFGTGDFSVEAWFYIISGDSIISNLTQLASPGDYGTLINWNGGSVLALLKADNANQLTLTSSVVANANGWNHVAFVRTGTTVSLYLNGSRVATGTSSITSLTDKFKIGGVYASNSSGDYKGYVTDLRVYKGAGPYNATSSSITVPTAPLTTSSNPSLLMNFTNAAIFDSAAKNYLETVGNAQIDTGTKKFGTGSLEFDGTGDWLLVPDNADLQLGPGNLTIEFWVYLATGDAGSNRGLVGKGTGSTKWSVSLDTTQKVVFSYGTSTLTSSGAITLNAWNHIAVVREGTGANQTKIYINGTNDGTGTVSTDFTPINPLYIGANGSAGDPMKGFIDELRITKGVARYTANFTPPALPFPNK